MIEENAQRNCKFLRILRDLFNSDKSKRDFATSVLKNSFSKDFGDGPDDGDLLSTVVDLKQPSFDMN